MKRIPLSLLCIGLFCMPIVAQESENMGGSLSVELSKKILPKWTLSLEEEFRLQENFSKVERYSSAAEISYKPFKFLKVGAAYNFMYNQYYRSKREIWDWEIRHRYYLYATGDYSFGRFNVSLRERFQSTYRQSKDYLNPKLYLRNRVEVEYDIPKSPFEPFVSAEMYYCLNQGEYGINRWRYLLGCLYKLNKKDAVQGFIRYSDYIHSDDDDEDGGFMFGLGYSHKF